jgi:DDE family transposase
MTGLTNFITHYRWEDIFTVWFVLVDDAHAALQNHFGKWRRRGPSPGFTDSEVISVALIADTFFAGDEDKTLSFVRQYHLDMFPRLPSPGQFNHRRRALCMVTEQIRRVLMMQWGLLEEGDTCRLTDSAPISVCTYTRAKQSRTIEQTGQERTLYFGQMPSRKAALFGFRLHVDTSFDQVVDSWLMAPASVHDSQVTALHEGEDVPGLMKLSDGAFNNPGWREAMRHKHGADVRVWALPRRDTRTPWPAEFRKLVGKVRRRVESALSVLCTVFNIEQPRSRSLSGLVARVATRVLAYTLCFITGPLLAYCAFQTQN